MSVGIVAIANISLKFFPIIKIIADVMIDPESDPKTFIIYFKEYANPYFDERSAIIASDGAVRSPFAKRSKAFAMKTKTTLNAHAIESLLKIVIIVPHNNIGFLRLKISIIIPANNFARKDMKMTPPSRNPNDFILPPRESTIKTGRSVKTIDDATPQQKNIQQIQNILRLFFLSLLLLKSFENIINFLFLKHYIQSTSYIKYHTL